MDQLATPIVQDFSVILKKYNVPYKESDLYYFQVGELTKTQGWILHVSTTRFQIEDLMLRVIPYLVRESITFKMIHNRLAAEMLFNGDLGYPHTGKALRIYPETDEQAVKLAEQLIQMTVGGRGPAIPTDVYLGGTVYTRYGSFNAVLRPNVYGQAERHYYNHRNQLVKDDYPIPFKMLGGITWPFVNLTPPTPEKAHGFLSVLNHSHIVTKLIKKDLKGNVFRTIRTHGLWFQYCLVKEGRHDLALDDAGRDVQERLTWQYALQRDLQDVVPVPQVYDLYTEDGNTYLVMEYVKGESLYDRILKIFGGTTWTSLDASRKLKLIDYIQRLITYLEILHNKGYVHRDFAPDNFLLDKHDRLVMIDLELAYHMGKRHPSPPFVLGTDGFMSPEQWQIATPTEKEDIYALGAMMIVLLTSLIPNGPGLGNPNMLEDTLRFFIQDTDVVALITRCLHSDPISRPSLEEIKLGIGSFQNRISQKSLTIHFTKPGPALSQAIRHGINALGTARLTGKEILWFSNPVSFTRHAANDHIGHAYYVGMASGIGGVMYTLSRARKLDIDLEELSPTLRNNFGYIEQVFLRDLGHASSGLYYGSYGLAMAFTECIKNQLLDDSSGKLRSYIEACLKIPCEGLDVATGLAGRGLALLKYLEISPTQDPELLLKVDIQLMLNRQRKDGSWKLGHKETGFSHGVAGIVLFLLQCYRRRADHAIEQAIHHALNWLFQQAHVHKDRYLWCNNTKERLVTPRLHDGYLGIALCFMHAFEQFQNPLYQQIVTNTLLNQPEHPIDRYLGLTHGLSGLGEVYLEASRIFREDRWQQRADWLVQVISRTPCYRTDDCCYWHVEGESTPTADLGNGHSGTLHFLMRYEAKGNLGFPML